MLDRLIAEKWLTARGVFAFWPCARDGDSVTIHLADEERHVTLPFLRQQIQKSRDRANMCLVAFIDPAGHWVGGFEVGLPGTEPHPDRFPPAKEDYSALL